MKLAHEIGRCTALSGKVAAWAGHRTEVMRSRQIAWRLVLDQALLAVSLLALYVLPLLKPIRPLSCRVDNATWAMWMFSPPFVSEQAMGRLWIVISSINTCSTVGYDYGSQSSYNTTALLSDLMFNRTLCSLRGSQARDRFLKTILKYRAGSLHCATRVQHRKQARLGQAAVVRFPPSSNTIMVCGPSLDHNHWVYL